MANSTDQFVFLEHRHDEQCADAGEFDDSNWRRITLKVGSVVRKIVDVDHLLGFDDATEGC